MNLVLFLCADYNKEIHRLCQFVNEQLGLSAIMIVDKNEKDYSQCTDIEIAANLKIGVETLHQNFREEVSYARAVGLSVLRLAQWEKAIDKKDTAMLKHLGKVYLGQRDEIALTTEEPSVRMLLNRWEGAGRKIDTSKVVVELPPINAPTAQPGGQLALAQ